MTRRSREVTTTKTPLVSKTNTATWCGRHRPIRGQRCLSLAMFVYLAISLAILSGTQCEAKVFERCELAQTLHFRHGLALSEVANWVCIAQHSSDFNSAAYAGGLAGGSHGLFQVSDLFWCSPPGKGFGCNLACEKLRDNNLADDLECVRLIHAEHQRISGDGYTAWNAYQQFCRHGAQSYIAGCFDQAHVAAPTTNPYIHASGAYQAPTTSLVVFSNSISDYSPKKSGKIYDRCELAQELYYKHKMPMEQIPTWVCIAQHESNFDTAAVGRLNTDGSADHGLFQISDLYWCSNDRYSGGKACGLHCSKLLDTDITDDVRCIRRIHNEHTGISGDGFTAWTVYNRNCRNQRYDQVASCFKQQPQQTTNAVPQRTQLQLHQQQYQRQQPASNHLLQQESAHKKTTQFNFLTNELQFTPHHGKVYKRCELAHELYFKHKFPMQDIATWVCIAQHESNFETSAVGRLNSDGSADHGLFQISDLYWCSQDSHSDGGKACGLPCHKLLDSDITDDVRCIRKIHEEHTRISGDGFTAWTVYNRDCRNQQVEKLSDCFDGKDLIKPQEIAGAFDKHGNHNIAPVVSNSGNIGSGKVYDKCELAQELFFKHKIAMEQIPTWLCIAQHESNYDTSAVGRLNTDGSADHGLFQISDLYWCSHDSFGGKACNIPCTKLLDNDISDDVRCIKMIYDEHTRISGDGFTAWTVYNGHCRNKQLDKLSSCFNNNEIIKAQTVKNSHNKLNTIKPTSIETTTNIVGKGKIYDKCGLAQELYFKHKIPMKEIPTWVCIAQHESNFNTAAVGRLNTDGSADHGLFQISDLYWCSHDNGLGKACNIPCSKLLDNDITDDVRCIKIIHEEHTRISGDGFTAWTVYDRNCRSQAISQISACFDSKEITNAQDITTHTNNAISTNAITAINYKPTMKKIYNKCELAQELYYKHKIAMTEIPTWVCIAEYESSFNTAAVGRLNTDGSADHGLFQISDLYWCSHDSGGGKACNVPCSKLLDTDITDDVRCIKIIHEEHTRISGDGFTAWTVYNRNCRNQLFERISSCFDDHEINKAQQSGSTYSQKPNQTPTVNHIVNTPSNYQTNGNVNVNPFLSQFNVVNKIAQNNPTGLTNKKVTPTIPINIGSQTVHTQKPNYNSNPFLQKFNKPLQSALEKTSPPTNNAQFTVIKDKTENTNSLQKHNANPFLNRISTLPQQISAPNFNVFSKKEPVTTSGNKNFNLQSQSHLNSNLEPTKTTQKPIKSSFTATGAGAQVHLAKPYVNSQVFRTTPMPIIAKKASTTTTTKKPLSTTTKTYSSQLSIKTTQKPIKFSFGATAPKLQVQAEKPYVNSQSFRTTPMPTGFKMTSTITTRRPASTTIKNTTKKPITAQVTKPIKISKTQNTLKPILNTPSITTTTRKPSTTKTTTKTTSRWINTTHKPNTSQRPSTNWTTTTKKPTTKGVIKNTPTNDWKHISTNTESTTKKPNTLWNWREQNPGPTTTKRPTTTTKMLTTTKASTNKLSNQIKATTTTKKPTFTTKASLNQKTVASPVVDNNIRKTMTTKPPIKVSTTKRIVTTTSRKPTTTWINTTTKKSVSQKSSQTTRKTTRNPITTTTTRRSTPTIKQTTKAATTTRRPTVTTKSSQHAKATTAQAALNPTYNSKTTTAKSLTPADQYKNDPFSHPFFAKYNEQFKVFTTKATTSATTKRPFAVSVHPTKSASVKTTENLNDFKPSNNVGSEYQQQYRKNSADNSKTVYAYTFGRNMTLSDAPVILTLPHMLGASNEYTKMIRGLKPDAKKHQTFVDVQHLTGTPLQGGKRVQFNMFLKSINRITITENLTTVLMPAIWVEEGIQLNSEMVSFFKKKLINSIKTLNIIHWASLCGGVAVAVVCLIYYAVQRRKPEEEAPLK